MLMIQKHFQIDEIQQRAVEAKNVLQDFPFKSTEEALAYGSAFRDNAQKIRALAQDYYRIMVQSGKLAPQAKMVALTKLQLLREAMQEAQRQNRTSNSSEPGTDKHSNS